MRAMYEFVGDRLQEIFDAQVVDIGVLDRETGSLRFPTRSSAASAIPRS